ncbi:hypothetical protein ABIQ69_11600 [Agromyces sp. G08B096]|uniref:Uncharacterized protein n=1 Tax=Agromyces sp. G08B096 TaxID=3156399 RepID=A0AAU7W342_9MICO
MPRKPVTADTDTDQLQDVVRARLASNLGDPGQPEGAAVAAAIAAAGPEGSSGGVPAAFVRPVPGSATASVAGVTLTAVGTATAASLANTAHQSLPRVEYLVTTASTSATGGVRSSAPLVVREVTGAPTFGGWDIRMRVAPAVGVTNASHRFFAGLRASSLSPTDVDPSTQASCIGFGYDSADTNLQVMHNDTSGNCTKADLGSSFPKPSADRAAVYEFTCTAAPGATSVAWTVRDVVTGAEASGTITTDLPASTMPLGFGTWTSVGGVSSTVGTALFALNIE